MCGTGNVSFGNVPKAASGWLCRTFFLMAVSFLCVLHAAGRPTDEFEGEIGAELPIQNQLAGIVGYAGGLNLGGPSKISRGLMMNSYSGGIEPFVSAGFMVRFEDYRLMFGTFLLDDYDRTSRNNEEIPVLSIGGGNTLGADQIVGIRVRSRGDRAEFQARW